MSHGIKGLEDRVFVCALIAASSRDQPGINLCYASKERYARELEQLTQDLQGSAIRRNLQHDKIGPQMGISVYPCISSFYLSLWQFQERSLWYIVINLPKFADFPWFSLVFPTCSDPNDKWRVAKSGEWEEFLKVRRATTSVKFQLVRGPRYCAVRCLWCAFHDQVLAAIHWDHWGMVIPHLQ